MRAPRPRSGAAVLSGHLYLYLLGVGILTALTPWAIAGVIVMLGSRAGAHAAVAFAVGWFCAIAFIATLVAAGIGAASDSSQEQASTGLLIAEVVLGVALLALAYRKHVRNRSAPEPAAEPGWLKKLDHIGPAVAFAFGTFMINVVFVVDAGLRIAAANPGTSEAVFALLFYTVISTASLIAVLVFYFWDRAGAEAKLGELRSWLARNNADVMAGIIAVVGVALALKGVVGLVS